MAAAKDAIAAERKSGEHDGLFTNDKTAPEGAVVDLNYKFNPARRSLAVDYILK